MKKIYFVLGFYTLLFIILFFTTLSLNYIEGDDATTLLYHLCGRNNSIQAPYSNYNSGLDFVLYFVNNDEKSLRNFAVSISFVFGYLLICLLAILIDEIFDKEQSNQKFIFLAILPFIIPDFIFNSLIINATNIGFSFSLLATILYLKYLKSDKSSTTKYYLLALSMIFMGVSIPFRWSLLTYFPFFISILIITKNFDLKLIIVELKNLIILFIGSILLGILFIYISGYNFNDLIETIIWGKKYMSNSEKSTISSMAVATSFLTIPFLSLLFFGGLTFFKPLKKNLLLKIIFILLPFVPYFILGLFLASKYLITAIPILIILSYYGFMEISKNKYFLGIFCVSLLGIWFVGIKVNLDNTLYGSGYGHKTQINSNKNTITEKNLDDRLKFNKVNIDFDGGFYIPTPEGPRPLFGYFYVIFGGLWQNDLDKLAQERAFAINELKNNNNIILLQDRKTAFLQCELYKAGYRTFKPFKNDELNHLETRDFYSKTDTIRLNVISDNVNKGDFSIDYINKNKNIIFRSSYSSLIYNALNQNIEVELIGPYTVYKKTPI